ncbi:hypothetical protein [Rhodopseudomonas pseudopalustris]|uniref:Uncharacterized protein n=1 Tax=Rhodopseudomonas pseudopalustris TaxID=1513892 RepID=A0A1H8SQA1_9BRAD|nr:hypothetical protein [Rhodopseudomonas pseudopalustris]SEO80747.1 hypothetical protein SAMN05444123_10518 [Rhodopseudomonas pseudopalustris]
MTDTFTIGKRLIPRNQLAFVEPYVPTDPSPIQTSRSFQARVVLLNRDSILIEDSVTDFAVANRFLLLPEDQTAINPAIRFGVELFAPGEDFRPSKPFCSRLRWRDLDGNDQSKLLLTSPEMVLELITDGTPLADAPSAGSGQATKSRRSKRPARGKLPAGQPS